MAADLRERVARAMCRATENHERYWIGFLPPADAVIAELGLTQAEPVGEWVMVPREPTHAMLKAGVEWGGEAMDYHEAMGRIRAAWGPMLAAAPAYPHAPRAPEDAKRWNEAWVIFRKRDGAPVTVYDEAEAAMRYCEKHPWAVATLLTTPRPQPQPQASPQAGEWVMVPREPTLAMLGAGRAKARDGYTLEAAWEAMLAAAPKRGGA